VSRAHPGRVNFAATLSLFAATLSLFAALALGGGLASAQEGPGAEGGPSPSRAADSPELPPDEEALPPAPGGDAESDARPSSPADGSTDAAAEVEPRMRLVVIDAATFGIDPVVGRVASARLRRTAEELGYEVLTSEETAAAAQQARIPFPPTPADLWRAAAVARAQRGVFARAWAYEGRYVLEVVVASVDGAGPFFARGSAGADDLRQVVDRLLRAALPPPQVAPPPTPDTTPPPAISPGPSVEDDEGARGPSIDELDGEPLVAAAGYPRASSSLATAPRPTEPELRRWQITLQTEAAFGAARGFFYNHLLGVRADFRITRDILIGAYFAYANLEGRNGRSDNVLIMGQFENRIRLAPDLDLTVPLRASVGYAPFNGPVIRLSAGLNYALSEHWEIAADLLAPTFWFLPNRTPTSLDLSLEITYRF
jgi:hypothetical protein